MKKKKLYEEENKRKQLFLDFVNDFLAAPSSSRSLIVGWFVGWLVRPSVRGLCDKVTFRVSNSDLYLPTYLPIYLCNSTDSSNSCDSCDRSYSSDSSEQKIVIFFSFLSLFFKACDKILKVKM